MTSRSDCKASATCSGRVEALRKHPAVAKERTWPTFLAARAAASGWALLVDSESDAGRDATRRLNASLFSGRLVSYSLALVEGAPQSGKTAAAAAHRDDGSFEVFALAVYERRSISSWCGEAAAEYFTLVLMKAAGKAIGHEQALLRLAWLRPALGDADHGCERTEQWFGGRPFVHSLVLALDPWWTEPAASGAAVVICPLPDDLRRALGMLTSTAATAGDSSVIAANAADTGNREQFPAERVRQALWVTGCLPADMLSSFGIVLGQSPEFAAESPTTTGLPPEPAPFGHQRWDRDQGVARRPWAVAFVQAVLEAPEQYQLEVQTGGWLSLAAMLERFPTLREASFGSGRNLAVFIAKDPSKGLELNGHPRSYDLNGLMVRSVPVLERLQAFVKVYASQLPPSSKLPVSELLENGIVRKIQCGKGLPCKPLLALLRPCALFSVADDASTLTLRPLAERLQLGIEELMQHPDNAVMKKLQLGHGSVPLAWLLAAYRQQLLGSARPMSVKEAAAMVATSSEVIVEPGTFLVSLRCQASAASGSELQVCPQATNRFPAAAGRRHAQQCTQRSQRPTCGDQFVAKGKTLKTVRALLDFYFEPFSVQNNRLLLHSSEEGCWRWRFARVASDLPRIEALLLQMSKKWRKSFLEAVFSETLENVRLVSSASESSELFLELTYQPDFRLPVMASHAPPWVPERFLGQTDSFLTNDVPEAALVLSYSLEVSEGSEAAAASADVQGGHLAFDRWQRRICRAILGYLPDIVCLQLIEANLSEPVCSGDLEARPFSSDSSALPPPSLKQSANHTGQADRTLCGAILARMAEEDYGWIVVPCTHSSGSIAALGFANAIFWRRSRWKATQWSHGQEGSVHVLLEPWVGYPWALNVHCVSSSGDIDLALKLRELRAKGHLEMRLDMPSVLCGCFGIPPDGVAEVLRQEGCQGLRSAHNDVLGDEPWTHCSPQGFRSTDGVWLQSSSRFHAVAALGGHGKKMRDAHGQLCRRTFPTDHIPLLVAFEHTQPGKQASKKARIANIAGA